MNNSNLPSAIDQRTLYACAPFADRCLNFIVEADGTAFRQDGPNIALLASLDHFARTVSQTELLPFRVRGEMYSKNVRERDANGQLRIVSQPTYATAAFPNPSFPGSGRLVSLLASISAHLAGTNLVLPPHLRLLLEIFFDHPISRCTVHDLNAFAADIGRTVADLYNDFVDRFRQALLAKNFLRRELHNWYLGSRENLASLRAYLDDLFVGHPSLTVLHLRLLLASPSTGDAHDVRALRNCRTKLFERMRRNPALFAAKTGYIWAILPSLDGRYDLHLTLLVNTRSLDKLLDDKRVEAELAGVAPKDYAELVGACWIDVAGGAGRYFRADREGVLYAAEWVHGEIRADDTVRRQTLLQALGYLAVRRALVRLNNEPRGEYFGMRERKARAQHMLSGGDKSEVDRGEDACMDTLENGIQNA
ncbi:hypothetical protein [Ralstonia pseudosolanacearum]|uniref:hypothetical protein n=1 Tax=Ralstonia pseudosolanacearum TaxID=1310165 RepID=UPI00386C1AF3